MMRVHLSSEKVRHESRTSGDTKVCVPFWTNPKAGRAGTREWDDNDSSLRCYRALCSE